MGQFPWYFRFFIKSCEHNPSIDFIIVTDQPPFKTNAKNIFFVNRNLGEINTLATKKLGFDTRIKYAYKLCDFKPAYGVIFSDLIEGYDFWGHGDIDVIFGNIRAFITEELLLQYDIISARAQYLSGFLTIFRNSVYINRLYEQSKDHQMVFQNPKHYCFDECNFQFARLKEVKSILEIKSEVESMTHVVKRLDGDGTIKAFFDHLVVEDVPGNLEWKDGSLFYNNKYEALLYHLILFKDHPYLVKPLWEKIPDRFFINEFSFSKDAPASDKGKLLLEKYNQKRAVAISGTLEKYAAGPERKPSKRLLRRFLNYCGIYKPLCASNYSDFFIRVEIIDNQLLLIFPDHSYAIPRYLWKNTFLLSSPGIKAEISFRFDPSQLTEALSFLTIGSHLKTELHKIHQ